MQLSKRTLPASVSIIPLLLAALTLSTITGGCGEESNPIYDTDLGKDGGIISDGGEETPDTSPDSPDTGPDITYHPGGEPCEEDSGPCCDQTTGTTHHSNTICEKESQIQWDCTGDDCGGTLRKNIIDRYCTGTSALCDGPEIERGWEDHQNCLTTEVCDAEAESCTPHTQCDANHCEEGQCCDLGTMSLLDSTHICNPSITEAWQCTSSTCGGAIERSLMVQYCDGKNPDCSGEILWTEWETFQECQADQVCTMGGEGQPQCITNRQQCDPAYCQTGTCCDLSTNTLYGPEHVCNYNYSQEQSCTGEPGSCGGAVETRISHRHCSGISTACDGPIIFEDGFSVEVCQPTETCNPNLYTCVDNPMCHDDYCQTGICCNTQTNRKHPASHICQPGISTEYRCTGGDNGCGNNVEMRSINRHCSGTTTHCDGQTQPGDWELAESCGPTESCDPGNHTCTHNPACRPDYCTTGPCCDQSTNTLRTQDHLCGQNLGQEQSCIEPNQCGTQITSREKVQYCSGTSPACDGRQEWQNTGITEHCEPNQVCLESNGHAQCVEDLQACLPIFQIVTGYYHTGALKNDGTVWTWGSNQFGQLGTGSGVDSNPTPAPVKNPDNVGNLTGITAISAGNLYTMALKNDGTVWGWGSNAYGRLGIGNKLDQTLPVQVKGEGGQGYLQDITCITANGRHSLAIDQGRDLVWAWGRNAEGQLGDGTTTERLTPVTVKNHNDTGPLTGVRKVLTGLDHTLALKNDGTLWTWGKNDYGQLGHGTSGTENNTRLPVQVKGVNGVGTLTGVVDMAAGEIYSLALLNDGTVVAWGRNNNGQLGDGTTEDRVHPVKVKGEGGAGHLNGIMALASMDYHTLALKEDGTMRAWGSNNTGQLGDGTTTARHTPVTVMMADGVTPLGNVRSISAGYRLSAALTNDGTIWTWGRNDQGQLGNGSTTNSSKPVQTTPF